MAVRQDVVGGGFFRDVGEDDGVIVAADKVTFTTAQGDVRELCVTVSRVCLESCEKEFEKFLL